MTTTAQAPTQAPAPPSKPTWASIVKKAGDPSSTIAAESEADAHRGAEGGGEEREGVLAPDLGASLPSRGFGGPQAGR